MILPALMSLAPYALKAATIAGHTANVASLLEMGVRVANYIKDSTGAPSLPEYTQSARLVPTVLIDKRVATVDPNLLTGLLQSLLSIYTGWYLMAVNMSMHVGNVKVMQVLDQFATHRSLASAGINRINDWANEGFEDDTAAYLPVYGLEADKVQEAINKTWRYEPEDVKTALDVHELKQKTNPFGSAKPMDHDKVIHTITEESNLAVGKLIDVRLVQGDQSVTIPVMVTLAPKLIDGSDVLTMARANNVDLSHKNRWQQVRSGEIRFFADYLFSMDLIEQDKKALMADKTGHMLAQRSNRTKNLLAELLSGKASPNTVSTMVIISKQTASDLETVLKGPLKNSHVRDNYFKNNATMMLIVVDTQMERFTIYQRGMNEHRDYTLADIKANAKKANGVDIEAVLKAYQMGSMPTL